MNINAESSNPEHSPKRSGWIITSVILVGLVVFAVVMWQLSYQYAFHSPQTLVNTHVVFAGPQTNRICGGKDFLNLFSWVACDNIGPRKTDSISLAVGDLNNDGLMDAVLGNFSASKNIEVHVCLGTRQGRSVCHAIVGLNDITWDVVLGDLNSDGNQDGVFALDGGRIYICLGDGAGSFSCEENDQDITREVSEVVLGDLNGDGYLDAILGSSSKNNLACLGNNQGNLNCDYILGTNADTDDIALGHLNNDEHLDVVFVNKTAHQICLNDGQATFSCQAMTSGNITARAVALADINNDDVVDAVFAAESVTFCLSDGPDQPFYSNPCQQIAPLNDIFHNDVALGDVNNDGQLDAVFSGLPNSVCLSIHLKDFSCQQISPFNNLTRVVALWQIVP